MIARRSTLGFLRKHAGTRFTKIAEVLDLPMVPDILNTMDTTRGARFIIMATAQVFKSLLGQGRAMRNMLVDPAAALWYAHPEKFIDDFADEKFNPLFDAMPVLAPLLFTGDVSKRARDRIQFDDSAMLLRSARVPLNRQSKTARDIYCDEPWTYEPGWIGEISKRRSSFDEDQSWREVFMSTGSVRGKVENGGEFTQLWLSSDQRRWHVRCPKCERLFYPRRTHEDPKTGERVAGLIYETILRPDGLPNEPAIAATVRYKCPRCMAEHADTPAVRSRMNAGGVYVSENEYAATAPPTIGWQVNAVSLRPWAPIALRMVLASLARQRGDLEPLKEIVMLDDADIWDESEYHVERKARPLGGYKMLDDWADEAKDIAGRPWRFAGIDVQHDHFVLTARKWARDSQSRQHYAEKIMSAGILKDRLEMCGIMPARTFLDCRHDPQRVRQLCALHGWRAVMGEGEKDYPHNLGEVTMRRIYSEPKLIDPWIGTQSGGRSVIAEFNFSKPSALNRLNLLRTLPRNDSALHWSMADDAPEWYYREADAFHRSRRLTAKGEPYDEWIAHGPDHAADGECIGVIAASMADLVGAESLQPKTEKPMS